jgi:hypothetical protein
MTKMKDHFAAIVDNEFEARSRKLMKEDLNKSDLEEKDLSCFPLKTPPLPMQHPDWVLAAYRIPYRSPSGELLEVMYRDRLFYKNHITEADVKAAGMGKYRQPTGHITAAANIKGNYPYLPPGGKGKVLLICEGEKKAVSAIKRFNCPVIGIGGATAWRAERGSNAMHPEITARITALEPEHIVLVVDPDITTNTNVNAGWTGLRNRIAMLFRDVKIEIIALEDKLDDYLRVHPEFTLEELLEREAIPEISLNMSVRDLVEYFGLTYTESAKGIIKINNNGGNVFNLIANHPIWAGAIKENLDSGAIEIFGEQYREGTHAHLILNELNDRLHMSAATIGLVKNAVESLAGQMAYSPTGQEILECGDWDGVKRIKDIFGKDRSPADVSVAEAFIYGYVKRVLHPGCYWRNMVILVGTQGVGKTGMARWLAGPHGIVAGIHPGELRNVSKDTKLKILRSHVALCDDIEGFGHADQGQLKSLITVTEDTVRVPYEKSPATFKRRGIMMGTSNQKQILPSDPTGQTRYGVVELSVMQDWEWLNDNRMLILAEARHMVDNALEPTIMYAEMNAYVDKSDLEEAIEEFAEMAMRGDAKIKAALIIHPSGKVYFKSKLFWDWYKQGVPYTPKDWDRKTLGATLRKFGFEYHQTGVGRVNGEIVKHVFEVPSR